MRPYLLIMVLALMLGCDGRDEPPSPIIPEEPDRTPRPTAGVDAPDADAPADDEALPESLPVADREALQALIAETADRGQILVIDFWATWCVPCVAMFPDLHAGLKELGDAVRPVTVTLDDPGEYEQRAIRFLADHNALEDAFIMPSTSEGQLAVVQAMGERWTDLVVPAILIYDAQGELAGEFVDADARADRILARAREMVERQQP